MPETELSPKWAQICKVKCPKCGGAGWLWRGPEKEDCPACNGTGCRAPTKQEINYWLAVNVKGWRRDSALWGGYIVDVWVSKDKGVMCGISDFHPLTDANHALMLVPKDMPSLCRFIEFWQEIICQKHGERPSALNIIAVFTFITDLEAISLAAAMAEIENGEQKAGDER